jgi:protein-arginine kinase activator protein McsA
LLVKDNQKKLFIEMRNRRNFFNIDDIDEIFRQMFSQDPFMGDKTQNSGKDDTGEWNQETYKSSDGKIIIHSFVRTSDGILENKGHWIIDEILRKRKNSGTNVEGLRKELQLAIENEDYEMAIHIRDKISKLQENQSEISKLEEELKECITNENFERAIEIKKELTKLKL